MNHTDPDPAATAANENAWLTGTTRFLDLDGGCWISIDDDPNLVGGYVATAHVDDGGYTTYEAVRGEIEELDEAKAWALDTFGKLYGFVAQDDDGRRGL